ncbi:hypothetical protein [Bradyrhizobium sp. LB13.1]
MTNTEAEERIAMFWWRSLSQNQRNYWLKADGTGYPLNCWDLFKDANPKLWLSVKAIIDQAAPEPDHRSLN